VQNFSIGIIDKQWTFSSTSISFLKFAFSSKLLYTIYRKMRALTATKKQINAIDFICALLSSIIIKGKRK
jgi:hypothetical protein